jgi:hypothetical protein
MKELAHALRQGVRELARHQRDREKASHAQLRTVRNLLNEETQIRLVATIKTVCAQHKVSSLLPHVKVFAPNDSAH